MFCSRVALYSEQNYCLYIRRKTPIFAASIRAVETDSPTQCCHFVFIKETLNVIKFTLNVFKFTLNVIKFIPRKPQIWG